MKMEKLIMQIIFMEKVGAGQILFEKSISQKNPFNMDLDKMVKFIQKCKVKDKEYAWKYSNFGTALLGYAIDSIFGIDYWDAMEDFLTKEIGLKNSYLGTIDNRNLSGYNSKNKNCGNWKWEKNNLIRMTILFNRK